MNPGFGSVSSGVLLVVSAAVPMLARLLPRASPGRPASATALPPAARFGLGLQDLFVGCEIAVVAAGAAMWLSRPWAAALVGAACVAVGHLVIAADYLIRRQTGVRFAWHFISYLRVLKCFAGSIQQGGLGLARLAGAAGLYAASVAGTLGWAFERWGVARVDGLAIGGVGLLGLASWLAQRWVGPAVTWECQNIWLHLQRKGLERLFRRERTATLTAHELLRAVSPQEHFLVTDPSRPLLRLTHGYAGTRRFDLDLRGERPHVVLLFLESFCASGVGVLGGGADASPEFDRLSREGVLFRSFYANGVQTARAVVAGLFGVPPRFTERPVQADPRGCPRLIGLPQFFADLGYHTAYLHNGSLAFEQADVFCRAHGFRELCGEEDLQARFAEAQIVGGWGVPDEYLMRYCADRLADQERRGQPTFATLFTMTNHHPFEVPAGFQTPAFHFPGNPEKEEFLRTFYYSDACLGLLMRLLRERQLERKCLFFILADTAQPLGEHDNWGVQMGLYEENVRIPLLIYAPGYLRSPAVIEEPASQMDLLPTFIDLFGHAFAHHALGTSLLRASGERPIWFNNPFGLGTVGQRLGRLKLIHECRTNTTHLYDLAADPGERKDLADEDDARTRALKADLLAAHGFVQQLYATNRFC